MTTAQDLEQRFASRDAKVAIIGLGYVGLPLGLAIADSGFTVIGIDLDESKVAEINAGRSYIGDVSNKELGAQVAAGRFRAVTDFSVISQVDAISICVPTPLGKTRDPDISYIIQSTLEIQKYLTPRKHPLVILESTTYPGTTTEVILPRLSEGDLVIDRDFHLAFSPERVDPGNRNYGIRNTPKIVGGVTQTCGRLAKVYYEQFISQVIQVSSTEAAEMVKLLENTFRSVNIGLVNEVAIMCYHLGIDVWEVIDAAASKPFGFMPFYPGPGLGGHCIPIDPLYLSWKLKTLNYTARFIELAAEINSKMPNFVSFQIADYLNRDAKCINGAKVMIVGVAYKKDTTDVRESPALDILRFLKAKGADLSYFDPFVPRLQLDGHELKSVEATPEVLSQQDLVVIVTNHSDLDYVSIVEHSHRIFDTRNATRGLANGKSNVHYL